MFNTIFSVALAFAADSTYTDLAQCKVFEEQEGGYQRSTCGRVDQFELVHEYDDEREDLTIKWGQKQTHLKLGDGTFNHLGPRVEWRLQNGKAYALIARLVSEKENRLYVVRLSRGAVCQIGTVDGKIPNANEAARDLADDPKKVCRP